LWWVLTNEKEAMSQTVHGVVALSKRQPVQTVDIVIPDPGPNDVIVNIRGRGVHTDLTYRDGGINDDFPSCSAMKRQVSSNRLVKRSPTSPSATS